MQRSIDSEEHLERPEYEKRLYLKSLSQAGIAEQRMVLSARDISVSFGDRVILEHLSLTVRGGDRVALVGPNGSGKTTLLNVLAGVRESSGQIDYGSGVVVGYLRQEHLRSSAGGGATVLESMRGVTPGDEASVRALLDQFLFTGREVAKQVNDLSYGERVRLELARLVGSGANLLLLDEPTNHLDLPAVIRLQAALGAYRGPLIVSSHDRAFVEQIGISTVWMIEDGALRAIAGTEPLDDAWRWIAEHQLST